MDFHYLFQVIVFVGFPAGKSITFSHWTWISVGLFTELLMEIFFLIFKGLSIINACLPRLPDSMLPEVV